MFFTVPAQPMSHAEEAHILLQTGCAAPVVNTLLAFADRYRTSMTSDAVQKNRKLGTRALMRIARRVAQFPVAADDLYVLLSRAILAEFLPATEAMNLNNIFEETGIKKRTQPVSVHILTLGVDVIAVWAGHVGLALTAYRTVVVSVRYCTRREVVIYTNFA